MMTSYLRPKAAQILRQIFHLHALFKMWLI